MKIFKIYFSLIELLVKTLKNALITLVNVYIDLLVFMRIAGTS